MTFVDLYAGIGGMRLGFEQAGFTCVFSSEWDKFAQQTYEVNFGEKPSGDITKIEAKDIPPFDVLVAGFPCQPYSIAGKQLGLQDPRSSALDEIVRIVQYHSPKIIFLENVGRIRHFDFINTIVRRTGYHFEQYFLDSKNFGVPQSRKRIFFIGCKIRGILDRCMPKKVILYMKTLQYEESTIRVGDILEPNVPDKYTISQKLWDGHQSRKKKNTQQGKGFGYSLVYPQTYYTRTLSARYGKDGSEILIAQEGTRPRKLTPRECARLQGFPDTFKIPVSDTQAYKQFGNSVTVPLIKQLAEYIKEVFE